jgi:FkbM family methyltransferase
MANSLALILRKLHRLLTDIAIFGPSIGLRGVLPRDAVGAVSLNTRVGKLNLRPSDSDMEVLREVFVRKQYDISNFAQFPRIANAYQSIINESKHPMIIDAGANIGAASIWFSRLFPESRIVAVEPDPRNAEICRRNCEPFANVAIVEAALGSEAGTATVRQSALTEQSWALQTERGGPGAIPMVTVQELLEKAPQPNRLFIAKIDIEGFEKDLFRSNLQWMSEASVILIELHDWMMPGNYSSLPFQKAMLSIDSEILILGQTLVFIR